jgi:hypothetical protein
MLVANKSPPSHSTRFPAGFNPEPEKAVDYAEFRLNSRGLVASLHRSQIPGSSPSFGSDAGFGSRILRLRRKIPLLFGEEKFKNSLFRFIDFKIGS